MSNSGGAWEDSEIIELNNPNREKILWATAALEGADYGVTVFLGHGYVENDEMGIPFTFLNLKNDEVITERELNPGTPWYMSVLDCCRKYEVVGESISFSKTASTADEGAVKRARASFEQALQRAEKGWVRLYAADLHQGASDAVSFSNILIKEALKWSETGSAILNTQDAYDLVSARFKQINPQQTPIHHAGRRLHFFPVAVGLKQ